MLFVTPALGRAKSLELQLQLAKGETPQSQFPLHGM